MPNTRPVHEVVAELLKDNPQRGADVAHALYKDGNAKIPTDAIPALEEALKKAQSRLKDSEPYISVHQVKETLTAIGLQREDEPSV